MDKSISYVTLRGHQVPKAKSLESLPNSISPETSFDNILGRSLDLSTHNIYNTQMSEMKLEINELKSNLQSTQAELEKIILENIELKKHLTSMTQEINILKQLCRSPVSTIRQNSMTNSKKKARRRLTDSFQNSPIEIITNNNNAAKTDIISDELNARMSQHNSELSDMQQLPQYNENSSSSLCKQTTADDVNTETQGQNNKLLQPTKISFECKPLSNTHAQTSDHSTSTQMSPDLKTRRLHILGSQQCKGLSAHLIKSRVYTDYEKYQISSFIKPNALTEEILKTGLSLHLNTEDKLVLCIGENDCNPTKLMYELSFFLKTFSEHKILILSVLHSNYLNVKLLNNHIKHICTHFPNCNFIDLKHNTDIFYNKFYNYIDVMCKKINYEIDCLDYNKKYLNTLNICKHNRNNLRAPVYIQKTLLDYYSSSENKRACIDSSPKFLQRNNYSFRK